MTKEEKKYLFEFVHNYLDKTYYVSNESDRYCLIEDVIEGGLVSPAELQEYVESAFDVHEELAHMIVFSWLCFNDYTDILDNWDFSGRITKNFQGDLWDNNATWTQNMAEYQMLMENTRAQLIRSTAIPTEYFTNDTDTIDASRVLRDGIANSIREEIFGRTENRTERPTVYTGMSTNMIFGIDPI
jgi:hypothetical protein